MDAPSSSDRTEAIKESAHRISESLGLTKDDIESKFFPHLYGGQAGSVRPGFDLDNASVAGAIDHTMLHPHCKESEIVTLCHEAAQHHFAAVCVNGCRAKLAIDTLASLKADAKVAAVIGFPLGAMTSNAKAFETQELVQIGVDEIDMVINVGKLMDGDYAYVLEDIGRVVAEAAKGSKPVLVKVILECGLLTKDQIIEGCILSVLAGAHYVKTSTGFISAAGGAKVEDVHLMKQVVGDKALVKASGGVGTFEAAKQMIDNGASRIGASKGVAIVAGEKKHDGAEAPTKKVKRDESQAASSSDSY